MNHISETLIIKYPNAEQSQLHKDDLTELGTGGTATVYLYQDGSGSDNSKAIKIYNPDVLTKHYDEYLAKLNAMLHHVPNNITFDIHGQTFTQFAWPEALVEDTDGRLVGYLMPALPNTDLYQLTTYIKDIGSLHEKHQGILYRFQVACNLAIAIRNLHKAGHYFIDMKTQNIFVFKDACTVCFIDCDGFAISHGKFKAQHYTRCYQAPEALRQGHSPSYLSDKAYQDYYCLAHLIFEILDYGNQPFKGILTDIDAVPDGEDTYDYKVKNALYPYGIEQNPAIQPFKHSIYQYLPKGIRTLFDKAFTGGADEIPNAKAWVYELKHHLTNKNFEQCAVNTAKHHDHFKGTRCFACDVFESKNNPNLPENDNLELYSMEGENQTYATDMLSTVVINSSSSSSSSKGTQRKRASDAEDWKKALQLDSIAGYEAFIRKHPNSRFEPSAVFRRRRLKAKKG